MGGFEQFFNDPPRSSSSLNYNHSSNGRRLIVDPNRKNIWRERGGVVS